jgi:beta-glucanase (GH16 family)
MTAFRKTMAMTAALLVVLMFTFCSKDKNDASEQDPSNLTVELLSVNNATKTAQIQASAANAVRFEMYIGTSTTPALQNQTGFFEYTFTATGDYMVDVRAYGLSGRYIKKGVLVSITPDEDPEVPLSQGYSTPMEHDGYTRVWNDEFSGSTLNTSNWGYDIGDGCPNCGWGNNELQYYRTENATVANDVLTIEARKESFGGKLYTSSRIKTQGKKSFRYGRVDIRALLPRGQGIWPALWMLGNNITTIGWPSCGEIDIMEMIGGSGRENQVHGTIHYNDNGHIYTGGTYTLQSGMFYQAYHVFTLIWDETSLKWYVNDQLYKEINIAGTAMTAFHQQFFFIFNVAVGGNWPGYPDSNTQFPQRMKVDYIRVFQRN